MTETERIMWRRLRGRKLNGLKFRRQHPIDIFIADFYCHEKKLIVELDGGIHDTNEQKDYDDGRSFELEEKGFKILRFRNEEVTNGIDQVLIKIIEACK
jgi:very-short-patch-repair endonuclease